MRRIVAALLALPALALAQVGGIGIKTGCFGFDGTPELACVGERVTCIARAVNYFPTELWSASVAEIAVAHLSGIEASGNLLTSPPVAVPPMQGSVEGAFIFTARLEDVPQVFTQAHVVMTDENGNPGNLFFPARVFVFRCDEPTLTAHRAAAIQNRYRVVCEDNPTYQTRVCRSATETFTAPIR